MRTISRDRLLYAGLTFLIVFVSYLLTLAPALTFWDAGEFIATARILGIPHPPGAPLFVVVGHVFGTIPLPVSFAAKMSLMSALASSVAGFFYFLVVSQIIDRIDRRQAWDLPAAVRHVGALAAVCLSAWGLTVWQNSTEAEVYTIALMTIALVAFLMFWWADHLAEGKDWNLLLLVIFMMGLSVGNHLMALLVMPAVVIFAIVVVWRDHRDYILSLLVGALGLYLVVMKGFSIDGILQGGSMINAGAMLVGLLVLGAGIWWMSRTGSLPFFGATIVCFVAGVSIILFLKIRAAHGPAINEANPESWRELLAVMARKQYDIRPILPRAVDFLRFQIPLYLDYLFGRFGPFESQVSSQFGVPGLTLLVVALAIVGSVYHSLADRTSWLFFLLVFLTTSLGLVFYLNFPLGQTQAPEVAVDQLVNLNVAPTGREVRERDYFFVVSFVFIGLWAGIGAFAMLGEAARRSGSALRGALAVGAATILLLIPAAVFAINHDEADRSGNYVAEDFAYNLLQSIEPWGILFTNGDNDTFPLWYLQEVEGVRRDVAIVNLALLNTLWYLEQLDQKVFTASDPPTEMPPFPLSRLASVAAGPRPTETLLEYTGGPDDPLIQVGYVIEEPTALNIGGLEIHLPGNSIVRRQDIGVLQVVRRNLGKRPIYFSVTVPEDGKVGLGEYAIREGIADHLLTQSPEALARAGQPVMPMQAPEKAWIHVARTEVLLEQVYLYRGVDDEDVYKDDTARALIGNYGATFLQLAAAQARRGETEPAIESLTRGHELLGRTPDDEAYLTSLINVFAVSGSYERLDSLLQAATDRRGAPLQSELYKIAAYNAAVAGHFEVARRVLDKYFRSDPTEVEPELWIDMSEMAIFRADTAQALRLLEKAIRADPDNYSAFVRHINLAHATGNDPLAKTFLYQWVRTHPRDTLSTRLFQEFANTGRMPDELLWEKVGRISPDSAAKLAPPLVDTLGAGK
ncbi:MAG: protein O-mannosyl-transferase family [Gemmatimonadota bacterium]